MTNLNRELIVRVMNEIKAEPALFDLHHWNRSYERMEILASKDMDWQNRLDYLKSHNVCGTVCCIAGHTVRLADPELFKRLCLLLESDGRYCFGGSISTQEQWVGAGSEFLGLTFGQGQRLFYLISWPPDLQAHYNDAQTFTEKAEVAVLLLQAVLDTNGTILDCTPTF